MDEHANAHGQLIATECLLVLFSIHVLALVLCSQVVLLVLLFCPQEKEVEEKREEVEEEVLMLRYYLALPTSKVVGLYVIFDALRCAGVQ